MLNKGDHFTKDHVLYEVKDASGEYVRLARVDGEDEFNIHKDELYKKFVPLSE